MSKKAIKKVQPPVKKAVEPELYIHELREHCSELFGVKPEVLDGAFFKYKHKKITKTEASKLIEGFLNKGVK